MQCIGTNGALAHLARAFDWQSKGDEFESRMLHSNNEPDTCCVRFIVYSAEGSEGLMSVKKHTAEGSDNLMPVSWFLPEIILYYTLYKRMPHYHKPVPVPYSAGSLINTGIVHKKDSCRHIFFTH